MKRLIGLLGVCLSSGCVLGPDYQRELPERFDRLESAETTGDMTPWWRTVDQEVYQQFVRETLSQNLSLTEAAERTLQAYQRLGIRQADRIPSASLRIDAAQTRYLEDAEDRPTTERYERVAQVSWQVDLFGKLQRSIESSEALFVATRAQQEALLHSLVGEMTRRYIAVSVYSTLLENAREQVRNREALLEVVERRYLRGARGSSQQDVLLAQENLSILKADVSDLERTLAENLLALEVVLGRVPGSTAAKKAAAFPLLDPPEALPDVLPLALLDRRPDLRASEFRLKAATADVGAALADLYPGISLGVSVGSQGTSVGDLFSSDSLISTLSASILQPLFNAGALRKAKDIQESEMRELAAAYAADILEAMREVETLRVSDRTLGDQLTQQRQSAESLRQAEQLAARRYRDGIQTLQSYLDIQQRRYQSDRRVLLTLQQRWVSRVNLYLALGGDAESELLMFYPESTP